MFDFENRESCHAARVGQIRVRLVALLCLLGLLVPFLAHAAEIGFWPFSEGTGSVTADISGQQHDGQLQSVVWTSGFDGGGLDFSDSAAVVVVASSPVLERPGALTFAAWVRQAPGGDYSSIIDKRDSGADGYDFYLDHQGRAFVRINSSTLAGVTPVADGGWHHVAGVWDGASISLYVDGTLDRSVGIPSTVLDVEAPLRIGGHFQGLSQFGFKEFLDEVRIFDSALTAVQVQALYDAAAPDVFPPVLSNAEPGGTLPAGTTQTLLGLDSDEPATCRWSDTAGTGFSSMLGFFTLTGDLRHETTLTGLADGVSYTYYVRCEDALGNANPTDLAVTFSVADSTPGGDDAIGHWSFDEGAGSVAADSSGNGYDGTLVNSPTWETGREGFGLAFRNADDYVDLGMPPALTRLDALSVAAWVRHPAATDFRSIVDARDGGADGYDLYLSNTGRGFVRVNSATLSGAKIVADDQWHHLAATWDGGTLSLYVDGTLDATRAASEAAIDVGRNVLIGRHFNGDARFENDGVLDNVRIYDRALSTTEIQELADPGPGGGDSTPPIRSNAEPSTVLPSGTTAATISLETDEPAECRWSDVAGISFEGMTGVFATTGGTAHAEPVTGLTDGESRSYFVRCSDSLGNANSDDLEILVTVAEPAPPPSGPIGYWPFSEGVGTSTLDASGNGHHGTLANQPSWSDGWQGAGLSFPGSEDGVIISASPEISDLDALSISVWIRHPEPVDFSSIVDQRDQVADGYDLYLDPNGRTFFRVNSATLVGTTPVVDSQWHHLAAVWDGVSLRIYVDGVLEANQGIGGTTIRTSAPLLIGTHFEDDSRFQSDGSIDELRLYDRALTSVEVIALATPPASHLTLEPGFPDKHVVQRVGTAADLPLAGSYAGSPTSIEARVVDAATGLPLMGLDWMVVDAAPSGGRWSGSLSGVPEGGWYRLELRFSDESVTLSSPARFGVGMVIAALGQSSMAKLFTEIAFSGDGDLEVASLDVPDPLTWRLGYGNPRRSATDLGGYLRTENQPGRVSRGAVTGAGAVRMANQLVAELQIPILVLDFAIDGTSILSWTDETWPRRHAFDSALASAGGEFELMLWFQGGSDILDDMPGATYQAGLDLFYSQIQDLLPAHRALEMLVAIQGRGDYPQPHDEAYREIRAVQFDWAEQQARVHHAGSAIDLHLAASSFSRGDGHYTASQMQILGDRYTRAILDLVDHVGFDGGVGGGQIASAVQIGSEVRVRVAHDQGSALTVPDPGADVEGFELSDNGFQTVWRLGQGISSATLSTDQQEVVLTLEQPVTGPLELRYLYGMNAFRHKATASERRRNGNTVFDDFAYHPERVGLPINPTVQAIDVSSVP